MLQQPEDIKLVYKYLLSPLPTLFCIICCDDRESPPLDLARRRLLPLRGRR